MASSNMKFRGNRRKLRSNKKRGGRVRRQNGGIVKGRRIGKRPQPVIGNKIRKKGYNPGVSPMEHTTEIKEWANQPAPWDHIQNPDPGSGGNTGGGDYCILSCTWVENSYLWECNPSGTSCPGTFQGCGGSSIYSTYQSCHNFCSDLCGCSCTQSSYAGGQCVGNWGYTNDSSNCLGYTDTPNDPNSACESVSPSTC